MGFSWQQIAQSLKEEERKVPPEASLSAPKQEDPGACSEVKLGMYVQLCKVVSLKQLAGDNCIWTPDSRYLEISGGKQTQTTPLACVDQS